MENKLALHIDRNWVSPYALWAYVALKEKRLPFTVKSVDLAAKQHQDAAYENLSLTAKVPMLMHGGFALAESSAIIEYLEDAFPAPAHPPLYPADARERVEPPFDPAQHLRLVGQGLQNLLQRRQHRALARFLQAFGQQGLRQALDEAVRLARDPPDLVGLDEDRLG